MICLKNPLQPANRLPPELIALCATFVSCTDPRPVITLTHICRYWRGVLISSHRNWAGISTGWKRLIPLCLERAGVVPLTVNISVSDIRKDWDPLQPLLPHVSRISDLTLTGHSAMKDVADNLPGFFSPMPNLTSLKLERTVETVGSFPPNETPVPPLFQNISKLKTLHLTSVPLYPTLLKIPSLAELTLTNYKIPFRKFVQFLESNTALEIVTLKLRFVNGSVSTVPERMVSLPRLRHLAFTCANAIDTKGLFSWLSFPRGVTIEIRVSHENRCSELASFLPCPPTPIRELLAPMTTIKYRVNPTEIHLSGNNGSFHFCTWRTLPTDYKEFDLFSTGAVREFHLTPSGHTSIAGHLDLALKRLPALEALVISRTSLYSEPLLTLYSEPLSCQSPKTIAFFDCWISRELIAALERIAVKREHSTTARLHRVVIMGDKEEPPEFSSIRQLRKHVPHVDVMMGSELPYLL